jgi:enterochelin esterase-like enzyme
LPTPNRDPCPVRAGTLEDDQLTSKQLGKVLTFRIYLPPCYQAGDATRYPVLYLLHGQGYQDDQWTRLGISKTADTLINQAKIDPLIIIMPYDSDWRQPTESHFGEAVTEELLPWIDSHYPTRAGRLNRAIGGLSRGAAWALHLGLVDWPSFGAIGAHSLPIFWSDTEQIPKWLNAIPPADMPRIFLDVSNKDEDLTSNLGFEALLNKLHIPHEWHLFNGYHDEAYWSAHVQSYLLWYSQGWPEDIGK